MNLNDAIQECWSKIDEGQVATYIPALAKVDPYQLGVYLFDVINDKKQKQAHRKFGLLSKVSRK